MHTVNGRVFCDLPGLEMAAGERVRWHAHALGSGHDVHAPTWSTRGAPRDAARSERARPLSERLPLLGPPRLRKWSGSLRKCEGRLAEKEL